MTGWNLPPGCNVRDLPGNSEDDEAFEKMTEELTEMGMDRHEMAIVPKFIGAIIDAYRAGYREGYGEGYREGEEMTHEKLRPIEED